MMHRRFYLGVVLTLMALILLNSWEQIRTINMYDGKARKMLSRMDGDQNQNDQKGLGALQHFRNRTGRAPSKSDYLLTNHEERTSTDAAAKKFSFPNRYEFEHAFDAVPEAIMNPSEIAMYQSEYGLLHVQGHGAAEQQNHPLIYFITPTYKRNTQMVDLARVIQTLMHDRGIYLILVEDSVNCTRRVRNLLDGSGLMYAHVSARSPGKEANPYNHRGVNQRNRALSIVEELNMPGIVYFGDDDNAYDIRLFPELRRTNQVSVFNVGFKGGCVVNATTGKVSHFVDNSNWEAGRKRKFQADMAGFAFHSNLVLQRKPRFRFDWPKGYLETGFLEQIVESVADMEPLGDNCTKTYVWHTQTKGASLSSNLTDPDMKDIQNLIRT